ncbi:MAG TPA: hypothetical protein VNO21_18745 [Polyangiaceae bacterium]|nr:hypothetical protein [Polyangiaceae bacterium]
MTALDEHRDRIMREVVEILAKSRVGRMVREPGSGPQGITGLLRAMHDALEGRETSTRTFWLETLFPSLIERGVPLVDISRVSARIGIAVSLILVSALPPELREGGGEWVGSFFSSLQADITRECQRAAAADGLSISGERRAAIGPRLPARRP